MRLVEQLIGSRVCAKYALKTPDALQLAGALFYGAQAFLTNDRDLKKVRAFKVLVIDDFTSK